MAEAKTFKPKSAQPGAALTGTAAPEISAVAVAAATGPQEPPALDWPKLDHPSFEVPAIVRDLAEKSVTQARGAYEQMKSRAEETTDVLEDTYETARAGLVEFQQKAVDALRAHADATFQFTRALIGARTATEIFEIHASFYRRQFETLTNQGQELQALAQKLAQDASLPAKTAFGKAFRDVRAA